MDAVLRLVPNSRLSAVYNGVGHFLPAMSREAMEEGSAGGGRGHQRLVDLEWRHRGHARLGTRLAHGYPGVGHDHIRAGCRLTRIAMHRNAGTLLTGSRDKALITIIAL